MRYYELYERELRPDQQEYIDQLKAFWPLWKKARRECSDIIKIYKLGSNKAMLHRGVKVGLAPAYKAASKPRPPENGERREEVDAWFTEHGFEAQRHNSIFVANNYGQAMKYVRDENEIAGSMAYIFPCNGFKYTWYRDTDDLYQLNFNMTLSQPELTIDQLMDKAQPDNTGIEDFLGTYRYHEMHFIGSYWSFEERYYGQLILNEMNGQGLQNQKRWGRISPDIAEYIGL